MTIREAKAIVAKAGYKLVEMRRLGSDESPILPCGVIHRNHKIGTQFDWDDLADDRSVAYVFQAPKDVVGGGSTTRVVLSSGELSGFKLGSIHSLVHDQTHRDIMPHGSLVDILPGLEALEKYVGKACYVFK